MPATQDALLVSLGEFLNQSLYGSLQARRHVSTVTEFVKAYTRGQGLDPTGLIVNDDLAAVIVTASARLLASPAMMRSKTVGPTTFVLTPFNGFTVAEQMVLNRYRQRTA